MKLPISAIIVGHNEEKFLSGCFSSLLFCDEILYFDLGSADNSIKIAEEFGAKVISHERVLSCEWIHVEFAQKTKYDWILITDPDEAIDSSLADEIIGLFENDEIEENVGAIIAPWVFYFKKRRLSGTPWGGINKRVLLVNNKRFSFSAQIHVGRKLKDGFQYLEIPLHQSNIIHHYWMQGYGKLLEKHLRYLKNEGEARYNEGGRTTIKKILTEPLREFKNSFYKKKGYTDGLPGFFLSIFWAWYQTSAQIALYKYQRKVGKLI